MSVQIDRLTAAVASNRDAIGSAVSLIEGLAQLLRDAIANGDPAVLDGLATDIEAATEALAAAVVANTPSA